MTASQEDLTIHTLGHSRHPIETFVNLAKQHGVELIVDVRGQPFSRFNPQFNRERFRASLAEGGIDYLWLGDRLSGRPTEPELRGPDGEVLWDRVRRWPPIHEALDRVMEKAAETPLALVCAEEDPMRCHRRFLLAPPLAERGARIVHIRGDGRLETEDEVSARETGKSGGGQLNLFEQGS